MVGMFGGGTKTIPEFTGLQVNTAVQVLPIPIVYGSPRVNINLIYYNGFYSTNKSSGGKGALSGGKGGTTVKYYATLIMAICEGPIGLPLLIYQDQGVWLPADYPSNGSYYFDGSATQAPWSYVAGEWPNDSRSYKNTAYYGFSDAQLDSSATVPQINLVVQGFLTGSCPLNFETLTITTGQSGPSGAPISFEGNVVLGFMDVDPGATIWDFLTDPVHGATFPTKWIDGSTLFTGANGWDPTTGDMAVSTFCQAVGLGWSVVLNNVESASSILERWTKNLNVAPVWNGAMLRFIPYWDEYASGNPGWDSRNGIPLKYYTPYTQAICTIPMDQILQSENKEDDPISFSRKDPVEVYNTVRVDFRDRTNFFNDNVVEAKDEAHVELYGPRVDNIGLANEFSLMAYANVSAQMLLRRNIGIMRTYTWKMGPLWGWLDPMDVLAIPDPVDYTKVVLVRVTAVEDDEEENVTVSAEEFPLGTQSPSAIATAPTTPPNQGITNVPPWSAFTPVIVEPPTLMLTAMGFTTPQIVLGASGGNNNSLDPNWGGCHIWVSLDDVNYEERGTLIGPSTIGQTTSALAASAGSFSVDLSESNGTLVSVSALAASAGHTLCVVEDASGWEALAYTTATLVGPGTYSLSGFYRGLYGTTSRPFGAGSRFLFMGPGANIFSANMPAAYIGKNIWVKLQSFNTLNNYTNELSSAVAYEYAVGGPTPVGPTVPPIAPPAAQSKMPRAPVASIIANRKGRR